MSEMSDKEMLFGFMAHAEDLQQIAKDTVTELRQVTDELKAVLAEFKAITSKTVTDSAEGSTPVPLDCPAEDAGHPFIDEPADSGASIFNKSIDELLLSTRARNCLIHSQITLIGQLVQCKKSEISDIENLGKKSFKEIENALKELNLSFNMQVEGFPEVDRAKLKTRYPTWHYNYNESA